MECSLEKALDFGAKEFLDLENDSMEEMAESPYETMQKLI